MEWINSIYYNQQHFINYTEDALKAMREPVSATSLMAVQNKQALDGLMAKEGGVCVLFGDRCCTYIPNNTIPGGIFHLAMEKLGDLRKEVQENAGFTMFSTDWFIRLLGQWGGWLMKMTINIGVAFLVIAVVLCCTLPAVKEMCL